MNANLDLNMLSPKWVSDKYTEFQKQFPRVGRDFSLGEFHQMATLMLCHSSAAVQQSYMLADKTVKKIHTFLIGEPRLTAHPKQRLVG